MGTAACRALAALLAVGISHAAAERPTQACNPGFYTGEVFIQASEVARQRILDVVANPARDPELFERLWRPSAARIHDWTFDPDDVVIRFTAAQDASEIARAVPADERLRALGVTGAWPDSFNVCGVPPPLPAVHVTEYHNAITDHYFLSSSTAENQAIDSGAAGPGWSRTGEAFDAKAPQACTSSRPAFRFYTRGANSHFFTVSTQECGFLRNADPGWIYEGEAFGAEMPANGACGDGLAPIYRVYNNRWRQNDSNHRYVTRRALYEEMMARGWVGEGVVMCVRN